MKGLILILALLVLASAQHRNKCWQFPIDNPTKINIQNQMLIVSGNSLGQVGVCIDSGAAVTKTVIRLHNAPIVYIERYLNDGCEEYVIVDKSGTVSIWNNNLTQSIATLDLNATVYNVAIREETPTTANNTLAINFKAYLVELSLNERNQSKTLNQNVSFIALAYTENYLIASTDTKTIYFFDDNGQARINPFYETITYLSRNNYPGEGDLFSIVGFTIDNRLVRIYENGSKEITSHISGHGTTKLNYLGYCKVKAKKGKAKRLEYRDMIVLVYNNSTLQLRTLQYVQETKKLPGEVVDVSCIDQHIYILYRRGHMELLEARHDERQEGMLAAVAGLSLIVLVFAFVGYQVAKRWGKKKQGKEAWVQTDQPAKDIELREFLLRESH